MIHRAWAWGLVVSLSACGGGGLSGEDGGSVDDGGSADAGTGSIAFSAPSMDGAHVRGSVTFQLVTTGPDPDRVELWHAGSLLVVLPPPYTYVWDTTAEADGEHVFEAHALIGGVESGSARRVVVVDRTPPRVVSFGPTSGGRLSDPITIVFSEPISAASVTDASISLDVGAASLAHTTTMPDDHTVALRISAAPASLPASAVLSVGTSVLDLAGNALSAEATHTYDYPAWVVPFGLEDILLPSDELLAGAVATSTGDVYFVIENTGATPAIYIGARRSGVTIPHLISLGSDPSLAPSLFVAADDTIVSISVVATSTTRSVTASRVEGTMLTSLGPALDVSTAEGWDVTLDPGGRPLVGTFVGADVDLRRLDAGAWHSVHSLTEPVSVTGIVVHADATHLFAALTEGYSCVAWTDASGSWASTIVHMGYDYRSGGGVGQFVTGGDGVTRALLDYQVNDGTGSLPEASILLAPDWTPTSFLGSTVGPGTAHGAGIWALATFYTLAGGGAGPTHVVNEDQSTDLLVGTTYAFALLDVAGAPTLVSTTGFTAANVP